MKSQPREKVNRRVKEGARENKEEHTESKGSRQRLLEEHVEYSSQCNSKGSLIRTYSRWVEADLRKCRVIRSICKQHSWIYGCDLYFMTFSADRAGNKGNGENSGTFQHNVLTEFLLYTLFSFSVFCISDCLSCSPPPSVPLSLYTVSFSIQAYTPTPTYPHAHAAECVCWPITQGNFFSFLRGFHQSPTTLVGRVDLIVSEIPLYSS